MKLVLPSHGNSHATEDGRSGSIYPLIQCITLVLKLLYFSLHDCTFTFTIQFNDFDLLSQGFSRQLQLPWQHRLVAQLNLPSHHNSIYRIWIYRRNTVRSTVTHFDLPSQLISIYRRNVFRPTVTTHFDLPSQRISIYRRKNISIYRR